MRRLVTMRVVVVTTSFPRNADDPSGHFVLSSARALVAAGHEVHVIAPGGSVLDSPALLTDRDRSGGGALMVHRAGGGALFGWPGAAARAREAPWRLLAAGSFAGGVVYRLRTLPPMDRAVAHWIVPCAWPLLMRTRALLEVFAHGADVRMLVQAPRPARDRVVRALLARGARFTFAARASLSTLCAALDPALAERLAARASVELPVVDVPDVISRAAVLRESLGLTSSERLGVVVCRLVAAKRVEVAIAAAAQARWPLRLVVVGDGPARGALEQAARAFGVQRVTFAGMQPRREALAWIAAADWLLHPSTVEAAPTVVREARALGVRVIACDAGDVSRWAESDLGIRVVECSAQAFARVLDAPA